MLRINDILDKMQPYLSAAGQEMIEKAYVFSAAVHQGQVRLSGEPYLSHPMEVAGILAGMHLDEAAVATGLLHDTVEDTLTTVEQLEKAFSKDVAFLVEGLTKISKITFNSREEHQAENFRKMILAMSADIRILLIRLADRIHNMRTLEFQPQERRSFIARETMELYAPLAGRLGIHWMKVELEDLAFRYLYPYEYEQLVKRVAKKEDQRNQYISEVREIIGREMVKLGIKGRVEGRAKHYYSIFKKMRGQQIEYDEIYDQIAFRVILYSDKDKDCYEALSMIHALWKPVPGLFNDYIAIPKANNYRSLHTTVIGPHGERAEIQIRTVPMHEWAEEGIAAHWRYKEGGAFKETDVDQIQKIRDLLEMQQELTNPREFMSNLKLALFPDEVYVFTPKGDVRSFPKGATPIDFAYSIHSDVGHQCVGAKVNRNIVPLRYELKNGDTVEIITQAGHPPSKDWLKHVVTSRAISKIKGWIKDEELQKGIAMGRDILEKEFRKNNLKFAQAVKTEELKKVFAELSVSNIEELMARVGYGKISAKRVVNLLLPEEKPVEEIIGKPAKKRPRSSSDGISLTGIEDVLMKVAKCCSPIPGEEIYGYISRGRGITVHAADCPSLKELDDDRFLDVYWDIKEAHTYPVHFRIVSTDKKGVLAEVSSLIAAMDINISHAEVNTGEDLRAVCDFILDISDLNQLKKVVGALKRLEGVISVDRVRKLQNQWSLHQAPKRLKRT